MYTFEVGLSTQYDDVPSTCSLYINDNFVETKIIKQDTKFIHTLSSLDHINIKIKKSGKTLEQVKKNNKQCVTIDYITLNNIKLDILCGRFKVENNHYVDDHILQTTQLNLNGTYIFDLAYINPIGVGKLNEVKVRDEFRDCDIACFGCSNTWGFDLDRQQTWPAKLAEITGSQVFNFGVCGSNIQHITALMYEYLKRYNCKKLVAFLPHCMRRQHFFENKFINTPPSDILNKDLILLGENSVLASMSGTLYKFLESCNNHCQIYFSPWTNSEYDYYKLTPNIKFLLPFFIDPRSYPLASDNEHFGEDFNIEFAKQISKVI